MLWSLILLIFASAAFGSPRFNAVNDGEDLPLKIERHKRMYFISGDENTKLQLSAKIPVLLNEDLYVAYTETGFWRLFQETSNPFEDINHNPELFYRWRLHENHMLDAGIEHLSNGKSSEDSRSWNDIYVQNMSKLGDVYFTTKVFYLWDIDATNEDIKHYLGFVDFEVGIKEVIRSKFQSNELYLRWRPGSTLSFDGGDYQTIEVGLKLKLSEMKYFQHFFINYYNGFAENQLNYNKYTRALRAGLTF